LIKITSKSVTDAIAFQIYGMKPIVFSIPISKIDDTITTIQLK